jgi:hypothetical protein
LDRFQKGLHLARHKYPESFAGQPAPSLTNRNKPVAPIWFGDRGQQRSANPRLDFRRGVAARKDVDDLREVAEHLIAQTRGQRLLEVLRAQRAGARGRAAGEAPQSLAHGIRVHLQSRGPDHSTQRLDTFLLPLPRLRVLAHHFFDHFVRDVGRWVQDQGIATSS